MKQKKIVLRASRFSLIMAFVLGTLFGLNSCRDEFNDEDALRAELEALAAARAEAENAARQRMRDSLNLVLIQQAQDAQNEMEALKAEQEFIKFRDSLAAISGVFNLSVNVLYGNTATTSGRTNGAATVEGAEVTFQQILRSATTGEIFNTVSTIPVVNGIAVIPNLVTGEVALTITKGDFTTAKVQLLLDAPFRTDALTDDSGFTPPVYNAAIQVPIWKLPAVGGTNATNEFAVINGDLSVESDLTNFERESLSDTDGVVVSAVIDGTGALFDGFTGRFTATQMSGYQLGDGVTDVQRISYEDAIFVGNVTGGSYNIVLPGTGLGEGVPYRMQFGEVALDQKVIAKVGDGDADFTSATVRATFGPGIEYGMVPNADAVRPTVSIPGPAAGSGVGALAQAEIEAGSGSVEEIRFDGMLGVYSQAPVVYTASSNDMTPVHPDFALDTDAVVAATIDANGKMNAIATATQGGQGYDGASDYDVMVKPYEEALMDKAMIEGNGFNIYDQSKFTVTMDTDGGSVTGITTDGKENVLVAPFVRLSGGSPDVAATATASVSGGKLSFTITNAGEGYESAPSVALFKDAGFTIPFNYVYGEYTNNGTFGFDSLNAPNFAPRTATIGTATGVMFYGDADIDITISEDATLPWDPSGQRYTINEGSNEVTRADAYTTGSNGTEQQIEVGLEVGVGEQVENDPSSASGLPAFLTDGDNQIRPSDGTRFESATDATPASPIEYDYYRSDNPEGDDFTQLPAIQYYSLTGTDGTATKVVHGTSGATTTIDGVESTMPSMTVSGPVEQGPHGNASLFEVEKATVTGIGNVQLPYDDFRAEFVSSVEEYAEIAAVFETDLVNDEYTFTDATSAPSFDETVFAVDPFASANLTVDIDGGPAGDANNTAETERLNDLTTGNPMGTVGYKAGSQVIQGSTLWDTGSTVDDVVAELPYEGFGYVGTETVTATPSVVNAAADVTNSVASTNFELQMGEGYVFAAQLTGASATPPTATFTEVDPASATSTTTSTTEIYRFLDVAAGAVVEGEGDVPTSFDGTESGIWRGGYGTITRNSASGTQITATSSELGRVYIYDGGSYDTPPTTPEPSTDGTTAFRITHTTGLNTGAQVRYYMSFDQIDQVLARAATAVNLGANLPAEVIMIDNNITIGSVNATTGKLTGKLPAVVKVSTTNGVVTAGSTVEVLFRGRGYNDADMTATAFRWATGAEISSVASVLETLNTFMPDPDNKFEFISALAGSAAQNTYYRQNYYTDFFATDGFNTDAFGNRVDNPMTDGYSFNLFADDADAANNADDAITGTGDVADITGLAVDASWTGVTGFAVSNDIAAITTALTAPFNPAAGSYTGLFVINAASVENTYGPIATLASAITVADRTLTFDEIDDSWDTKYSTRVGGNAATQAANDAAIRALASAFSATTDYSAAGTGAFEEVIDGTTINIVADAGTNGITPVAPATAFGAGWAGVEGYILDPTNANVAALLTAAFTNAADPAYAGIFAFSVNDIAFADAAISTELAAQTITALPGTWNTQFADNASLFTNGTGAATAIVDRLELGYVSATDYRQPTAVGANDELTLLNDAYFYSGGGATLILDITPANEFVGNGGEDVIGVLNVANTTDIENVLAVEAVVEAAFVTPAGGSAAIRVFDTDNITDGYDISAADFNAPGFDGTSYTGFTNQQITGRIDRYYEVLNRGTQGLLGYQTNTLAEVQMTIPNDGSTQVGRFDEASLAIVPRFSQTAAGAATSSIMDIVATGSGYTAENIAGQMKSASVVAVKRNAAGTAWEKASADIYVARELLGIKFNGNNGNTNAWDETGEELFRGSVALTIDAPALSNLVLTDAAAGTTVDFSDGVRAKTAAVYNVDIDATTGEPVDADNDGVYDFAGGATEPTYVFTNAGSRITEITIEQSGVLFPFYVYNWVTVDPDNDGIANTPQGIADQLTVSIDTPANGVTLNGTDTSVEITGANIFNHTNKLYDVQILDDGGKGYTASPLLEIMNGTTKLMGNQIATFNVDATTGALSVATVPARGTDFTAKPDAHFSRDFRLMAWFDGSRIDLKAQTGPIRNVLVRNAGSVYFGTAGEPAPVEVVIEPTNGNGSGAAIQALYDGNGGLTFDITEGGVGYTTVPNAYIRSVKMAPSVPTAAVSGVVRKVTGVTVAADLQARLTGFTSAPFVYIREVMLDGSGDPMPKYNATANSELFTTSGTTTTYTGPKGLQWKETAKPLAEVAMAEAVIDASGNVTGINVTNQGNNYRKFRDTNSAIYVYITTVRNNGAQYGTLDASGNYPQEYVLMQTDDSRNMVDFKTGEGTVDKASTYVYHGGGSYDLSAPTYAVYLPGTLAALNYDLSTAAGKVAAGKWINENWIMKGHEPAVALASVDEAAGTVTGVDAANFVLNGTGYTGDMVEVVFLNHKEFSLLAAAIEDPTFGGALTSSSTAAAQTTVLEGVWANATPQGVSAKVSSTGEITEITWTSGTGYFYFADPSVTISALIGSGAEATASTNDDGELSGITVTAGGADYARNIPEREYFTFGGVSTVGSMPNPLNVHLLSGQSLVRDAYYGTGLRADAGN